MQICYEPIGVMHCELKEPAQTPSFYSRSEIKGEIEVFEQFQEGLTGIEACEYITVIFHFDRSNGFELIQRRRGVGELSGVFNLRTPRRPNPIGLSILKLERIEGNRLFVANVDMLDATPILDLKPYAGIERD